MTIGGSKVVKNHAASVRARLLEYSRSVGQDFQRVLTRYALERLLFRLCQTEGTKRYMLKGAMLFATWPEFPSRATADLDLLGHGDPTPEAIKALFLRVFAVQVPADAISFDTSTLRVDAVREDDRYPGVRVTCVAAIGQATIKVQVDIGFGGHVYPEPMEQTFRCLLTDLPAPSLLMYPPATVVAEKFEAMISLGERNSRIRDFYDLWVMTRSLSFELSTLVEAVTGTMQRRATPLPTTLPVALYDSFAGIVAKEGWWASFLRDKRPSLLPPSFPEVQVELRGFFGRVVAGLAAPEVAHGLWDKTAGAWTHAPPGRASR